ncbi:MAG: heavy metal-binding domain-containing protein [Candidatus Nanopelagicales bacterium]
MTDQTGSTGSANPPAGWYPDPHDPTRLRWWDGAQWTDQTQASISEQQPGEIGAAPAQYSGPPIIVVTTNDLPGYRITEVHGEVFGVTVRARNAFSNMGASFRTLVGGEAKGYTKLLADSRLEAVDRLRYAANQVGANAVVAMRYDSGEIADMMNEVAAYGTAVTVERI